jgi:hypothetical protein
MFNFYLTASKEVFLHILKQRRPDLAVNCTTGYLGFPPELRR